MSESPKHKSSLRLMNALIITFIAFVAAIFPIVDEMERVADEQEREVFSERLEYWRSRYKSSDFFLDNIAAHNARASSDPHYNITDYYEAEDEARVKCREIAKSERPEGLEVLILMKPYLIGVFLVAAFFPGMFWLIYFIKRSRDRENRLKEISSLKQSDHASVDYSLKANVLIEMRDKGALTQLEFDEKHERLIQQSLNLIKEKSSSERKEEIKEALDKALELGIITREEYENKLNVN